MRNFLLLFCLLSTFSISAQSSNFWASGNENTIPADARLQRVADPSEYTTYKLDFESIKDYLSVAPMEFTSAAKNNPLILSLPFPDGSIQEFEIVESPVMQAGLASRYPNIKTYSGRGVEDRSATIRFDHTPLGFHGVIFSTQGTAIIDTYAPEMTSDYISYWRRHLPSSGTHCGVDGDLSTLGALETAENVQVPSASPRDVNTELLQYRMAMACTGEWGSTHGNTVPAVMANFATITSTLNGVYEREAAFRFVLIDNNDELVFLDNVADPYLTPQEAGMLLGQNVNVLDGIVGNDAYDIGHVFTINCTQNVGGIAGGGACTEFKGAGVTCNGSSNILGAVLGIMTHEIGHQFSCGHTFNKCDAQVNGGPASSGPAAWEPGSGSTIMSYQGSCGSDNITGNNPFRYFNVGSLWEMYEYSRNPGGDCAEIITLDHNLPTIEMNYRENMYIPITTFFELDMICEDQDGDEMTYTWEQHDVGPGSDLGMPIGNAPSFRSYWPDDKTNRYFPNISRIVGNSAWNQEVLPTYSRDFTFWASVRDNNPSGAGVVWQEIAFKSTDTAGPFRVSSYNQDTTFEVGQYVEITWDVANTDNNLVDCHFVNIRLSLDGGLTYPVTIVENVPNNGSRFITIPDQITGAARFRVEAVDNIFFDINNRNATIVPPSQPGYTVDLVPFIQQVCLPNNASVEVTTSSLLDFSDQLSFEVNNLPAGATASFSPATVNPGETSTLTVDMSGVTVTESTEIEILAISSTDTTYRSTVLDVVATDFSALALSYPEDGLAGVPELPTFTWDPSPAATAYDIEIATNPAFGSSIVDTQTGISGSEATPLTSLLINTLYYWRVKPSNICGDGEWSDIFTFHTEVFSCSDTDATNVPFFVASSVGVYESKLNISNGGTINDLNVDQFKLNFAPVGFLEITLVGPTEIEVLLFDNECGSTNLLEIGFDDEAASEITCPPSSGAFFQPSGDLSAFDGTDSEGEWTLKIEVTQAPFNGGDLEFWGLTICSNSNPAGPYIVNNEVLAVAPDGAQLITETELLVQDDNNTRGEIVHTVVTVPTNGDLYVGTAKLEVGDTYSQASIDAYNLRYEHTTGNTATTDQYTFTVNDGEGGFIGTTVFNINIDPNAPPLSTEELIDVNISLYPNPAQNQLNVFISDYPDPKMEIAIYDVQGKLIRQIPAQQFLERVNINTADLSNGIYLLQVKSDQVLTTKKFSIQK